MNIKTVIWDWNGTLLNDLKAVVSVNNEMLVNRQLSPVTTEFYLNNFDFPVSNYYKLSGFDLQKEPFEQLAKEYMDRYMEIVLDCPLQQGAPECLTSFKNAGIRQFILSAKEEQLLRETVPKYQIESYFTEIAGINTITADGKIKRGLQLINDHQINPEETIFIGDTTHDHNVACHYGMTPFLCAGGHHAKNRLLEKNKYVFDNLLEIEKQILSV